VQTLPWVERSRARGPGSDARRAPRRDSARLPGRRQGAAWAANHSARILHGLVWL